MSKIKIMSETLANKIAAGEVIERVANVVKELVENSIDAKSTSIKIDLIDSGKTKIEVIDNGTGMDKSDARACFLRHATSKIYKDDDLFFINSLGFRGEALASIASVSLVNLKTFNGEEGLEINIRGGNFLDEKAYAGAKGTRISVNKLFFNTPARLKYLKSDRAELNLIIYYVEKISLANPNISFELTNNNHTYIKTSGKGDALKTIFEIYGLNVTENMLKIKASSDDADIEGYISRPEVLKKNRNHMNVVINGRTIKNYELLKTIDEAYHSYKPPKFYPVTLINIWTDPSLVDVNVHPTKQDINISKLDNLKMLLTNAIKKALEGEVLALNVNANYETNIIESSLPKNLFIEEEKEESTLNEENTKIEQTFSLNYPSYTKFSTNTFNEKKLVQEEIDFKELDKKKKKFELYPVGIAFATYIIAENKDALYLIDQHAAQERINYEKVLKMFLTNKKINMLIPITLELSKSEFEVLKKHLKSLEDIGFEIEEFGINTVKIDAHPTWIKEGMEKEMITDVINTLVSEEAFDPLKFNDKVAATIACKASIKGNQRITLDAANYILEELALCDNPYNCPHGRPTIIKFTTYELEKMFKRSM